MEEQQFKSLQIRLCLLAEQAIQYYGQQDLIHLQSLDDLQEFVALDQIPRFLGGTSPREWPYGEGGDLPKGEGAAMSSGSEDRP